MNTFFHYNKQIFAFAILFVMVLGQAQFFAQNRTQAGTVISNFAKGTYQDELGKTFETISSTVKIKIRGISSIVVTPDETTPTKVVSANQTVVREFSVCNTGNLSDNYTITRVNVNSPAQITGIFYDVNKDKKISSSDIEVTLNQPLTNKVAPGSCIKILVRIDTNDITPSENLKIDLTARSNNSTSSNGIAQDSGRIVNSSGKPPKFTDPDDPTLKPSKLVQNEARYISGKNEPLEYLISFKNNGEINARNVVITDKLPVELTYIANSIKVNGQAVTDASDGDAGEISGRTIKVKLSTPVKPGDVVRILFKAMIVGNQISAKGIVNRARVSADNAAAIETTDAIVVIDPFGTVYAARGGAGSPIPGAQVVILTSANGSPLAIPSGQGFKPNFDNANPYLTNTQGRFSFALLPSQLGTSTQAATYVVRVTAENFRSRLLQISLSPNGNGLFKMTVRPLDGMPLATAGGFDLTESGIVINSIADIAFNIPMFENSTLEVNKTVDRIQAGIGDIVNYRVEVGNSSVAPIFDALVKDTLPNSFHYVKNSATVQRGSNTTALEPKQTNNLLEFNLGKIESGERLSILYRVRIGVNVRKGENYNSAIVNGKFGSGEIIRSAESKALVKVDPGMFSMRQFILGRIYVDENQNNVFDKGEKPVIGARVYLANGNSAVTDSHGLYSIPSVSMGAQVISLDPITIPKGYVLTDGGSRSGKDWTRLLRTPLGGGGLLRQNFSLVSTQDTNQKKSSLVKTKAEIISAKVRKSDSAKPKTKTRVFKTVLPGDVEIHDLSDGDVINSPAVNVDISVAQNWTTQIELNGKKISNKTIGTTRKDPKNKIVTYTFIGLNLKPGPNKLRVTAVGPGDAPGKSVEIDIYGRGPAKRLEIISDRSELQASGRDSTSVVVQGFDEWGNPAQDSSIMVQTSAGRLLDPNANEQNVDAKSKTKGISKSDLLSTNGKTSEQENGNTHQQLVSLVNGVGSIKLISDNKTGVANISAVQGQIKVQTEVRFTSEIRPGILAGLAEVTVGKNAPEMKNREVDKNVRGHIQFFYRGRLWNSKNMLTLAYDSQQPLNRVAGRDRLFQLNPIDQVYPLFGDSSTRFQETESNSKVYARFDRGRSYALFGDFEAGLDKSRLLGYTRKLTGAKIHVENRKGDHITVTGARPDTAFARQVIPGGSLGLVQLAYGNIMPGSEVLAVETRSRRNPEIIVSRETLTRSVDYNIDTSTGTIFFLRQISAFDRKLNLNQIVATYEYRSDGFESAVYTVRARKNIEKLGLGLGFSYVNQRQADASPFQLSGFDAKLNLPNRGKLEFEWAMSKGALNNGFGFFGNSPTGNIEHNGNAFFLSIVQPLPAKQTILRFDGYSASRNFYNPFGATVTPGSTRGVVSIESKPLRNSTLRVNLVGERNLTDRVDNNRINAGLEWSQTINEKVRFNFGYDFRRFSDSATDKTILSNLVTIGTEFKPTAKLDFSIKREQNLGDEDPSFPNQTIIGANYQVNNWAKLFFTQRLASNPITPISDITGTGFGASNSRNETAIGVETSFGKYTSLSGRYQLENGINGTDSFSIIGLKNRLPINKEFSVELGFERAFHLAGNNKSYNNFIVGANWLPDDNFRSSFRYEVRDKNGFGQVFSLGAAGKIKPGWTTLGRFQYGNINLNGRKNRITNGQAAIAIRPHDTDKYGLLLGYRHRKSFFSNGDGNAPNKLQSDVLSIDGFHQTTRRLELYGRFALKFGADGNSTNLDAGTLTYLMQGRAQYRLSRWLDIASEGRYWYQPTTGSKNSWFGLEAGFWATPDVRLGAGYNFSRSKEVYGFNDNKVFDRKGYYFVISTKVSRLFNLFGTSKKKLKYKHQKVLTPTTAKKRK